MLMLFRSALQSKALSLLLRYTDDAKKTRVWDRRFPLTQRGRLVGSTGPPLHSGAAGFSGLVDICD